MFPPNSDTGTVTAILERVTGCHGITLYTDSAGWCYAVGLPACGDGLLLRGAGQDPRSAGAAFLERNLTWIRHEKMREQEGRCLLCTSTGPLQLHHLEERSHGRNDRPSNLVVLCHNCHEKKTGMLRWNSDQ